MSKPFLIHIKFIFLLVFAINSGYSQVSLLGGINIGGQIGFTKLATELPTDFSGAINEFDNKIGIASDVEITKYVSFQWEIGTGLYQAMLTGETYNPEFSAEGVQGGFPESITEPVEYKNRLLGQNFFFRYYLKKIIEWDNKLRFNPFIKAGIGYINYKSELKYIDAPDDELIFGKGVDKNYLELTTGIFTFGTGFKTFLTSRLNMITSLNFNIVGYDFLDVVHNFESTGERKDIIGICPEFKVGLYYNITKLKAGEGRKMKYSHKLYIPFSPVK